MPTAILASDITTKSAWILLPLRDLSNLPAIRIGAARAIVDFGVKMRQMVELEEWLTAMEAILEDRNER